MAEHIVVEAVFGKGVGLEISVIVEPVLRQPLRAKDENGAVSQLVVLDDGQGREGLPEPDAVRQDAAVIGFQLVDDSGHRIALEGVELLPDEGVLVAGQVIGQNIVGEVFQELVENIEQNQKINTLRRVLLINGGDVIADIGGDVLQSLGVVPDLIEQVEVGGRDRRVGHLVDDVGNRIALLNPEINRREPVQRQINRRLAPGRHRRELLHRRLAPV